MHYFAGCVSSGSYAFLRRKRRATGGKLQSTEMCVCVCGAGAAGAEAGGGARGAAEHQEGDARRGGAEAGGGRNSFNLLESSASEDGRAGVLDSIPWKENVAVSSRALFVYL